MHSEYSGPYSSIHSVVGVALAILVWIVVWLLAFMGLKLLDMTRGLEQDWLQGVFRETFAPGVGGYAAIRAVRSWLPRANLRFVLWAFSVPVFLFMIGLPLYFISFLPEGWTFSWGEQVMRWLGGAATIFGAWLARKRVEGGSPR